MELLREHFARLSDKRKNRRKLQSLRDIVSLCICGEDDFVGIALWAQDNEAWLRAHLDLPYGIPSHDTLNRVFQVLALYFTLHSLYLLGLTQPKYKQLIIRQLRKTVKYIND